MIVSYSYDVEILPNFFSISIVDVGDYLKVFSDATDGKKPIPLVQKYTVAEIKEKLASIRKYNYWISDTDDSQLLPMLSTINNMRAHRNAQNVAIRTDMFGYNSGRYDRLMVAALLMFYGQTGKTKDLITRLYNTSKSIIEIQNNPELQRTDYFLNSLKKYNLPYVDIDIMSLLALNKVGKGVDKKTGETIYFPKGLKQTSINLQWYELLEHELPPITEKDAYFYEHDAKLKGLTPDYINKLVDKWDRYIHPDWIEETMIYNENDTFIVCEMIRLYIDEIRLRYTLSKTYEIDVLSSSRSDISNKLFTKFYSEFSGLHPSQWQGKKTERPRMSFKRVILPIVSFKTPVLKQLLDDMKKVVVSSIGKGAFEKVVKLGNLEYTIATGGLHSIDAPRELRSKVTMIGDDVDNSSTGEIMCINSDWSNITDDSYIYVHWDIGSFYPALMSLFKIAPAHLNEGIFVKLITWLKDTRIRAKHSTEPFIDGIPAKLLAEALKIVINSIYGKLGYFYGDLFDQLAVLKVTINGQLLIMMLCEELFLNDIEVISANTDGIVVKLFKKDKELFDRIANDWKNLTGLDADSEELAVYINRDINNYYSMEFNGKLTFKGALNPKMYAVDLAKGYDMPVVAQAVFNYFSYNKPVLETLYECRNILDFCKTQNVGKQYHIEISKGLTRKELQRNARFYVANKGVIIEKVNNYENKRSNLCAGYRVSILNSLDDIRIEHRDINYKYYYDRAMDIINPIKLGISPNRKGDKAKGTKSGKALIKQYSGQFLSLFDDAPE